MQKYVSGFYCPKWAPQLDRNNHRNGPTTHKKKIDSPTDFFLLQLSIQKSTINDRTINFKAIFYSPNVTFCV